MGILLIIYLAIGVLLGIFMNSCVDEKPGSFIKRFTCAAVFIAGSAILWPLILILIIVYIVERLKTKES